MYIKLKIIKILKKTHFKRDSKAEDNECHKDFENEKMDFKRDSKMEDTEVPKDYEKKRVEI